MKEGILLQLFAYPAESGKRPPQQLVKEANARMIFSSVLQASCSRADLARMHALSPTTVSVLTDEMMEKGFLTEGATAEKNTAGRKATLLQVNPGGGNATVLFLKSGSAEAVFTDLAGVELGHAFLPFEGESPLDLFQGIFSAAKVRNLMGVCLIPSDGYEFSAGNLTLDGKNVSGWDEKSLRRTADELRLPILVGNPASFAVEALAEGRSSLLYLRFDRSIQTGVLLEGKVFEVDGNPPSLAHFSVDAGGPVCSCGRHGCLRCYWERESLAAQAGKKDWKELCDAYRGFDPESRDALGKASDRLAEGLENLFCLFPVKTLVLDGLEDLGEGFLFQLRKKLSLRRSGSALNLKLAPSDRNLAAEGAVRSLLLRGIPLVY